MAPKGAKSVRAMQRAKIRKFKSRAGKATRWLTTIPNRTHMFRRVGVKTMIYVTGAGTITYVGDPGLDSGITLSTVYSDTITNFYQFGWSHNFRLQNVLAPTDFTNLYDRYKIVGVKYRIFYHQNQAQVQGAQMLPLMHFSLDSDDSTAPGSLSAVSAKGDCKTKVLGNQQYIQMYIRPKVAGSLYQSGVTAAYDVEKSKWINSTYPAVEHYGIKTWLNNVYMAVGVNTAISIEPVYYIACKDSQ